METSTTNSSSESDTLLDDLALPRDVIERLRKECEDALANDTVSHWNEGEYCRGTFDGWSCWNNTPAGQLAFVNCPDFIPGFDSKRQGHKYCTENGTWFKHPETNEVWSNYTGCVDISNLELYQTVNRVYVSGYIVSLVALTISLFIFLFFRSLKCKRVTIHKNLFSSFLVNNALWLIWHLVVAEEPDVVRANGAGCQVLHVFLHYFLVSNYFWMFCEGLYLHTLLVIAFVAEDRIMKWFFLLGWGLPALLTTVYTTVRAHSQYNKYCWIEESPFNYILSVPVVISMFINLFFLVNIVRVLLTKLRAANTVPDNHSTRKAVRATLILIPLLGLHYILTPFRPPKGSPGEAVYLIVSAIASSFQGLAVSLLFCFFNGEVLAIFRKKWNQHWMMRRPASYAATSVSYMKSSVADGVTITTNYGVSCTDDDL